MRAVKLFPGMRLSPDGSEYRLFERAEDVPGGWLRESPESFAKKGLGAKVEPEARKPGRPKKDESIDL